MIKITRKAAWKSGRVENIKQLHNVVIHIMQLSTYFFLCLFFLKRFLRLWVDILCLFFFFPLGIVSLFRRLLYIVFNVIDKGLSRLE